jgi:NhaA family Na+:H+ antiporter
MLDSSQDFARYLRTETVGGLALLAAAALALVVANSPLSDEYEQLKNTAFGPDSLQLTVGHWITDGLLTVFFFVIGLELKRELVVGELRDARTVALPVFAALGGMVAPASIFLLVAGSAPGSARAWAVPVATDIAFALAVLALTGSRLPSGVRVFLLSLAVVDDLGAIGLIAILFTTGVALLWLLGAAACAGLWALGQRLRIRTPLVYVPLALATWLAVHEAGIHATIAGVLLGVLTRVRRDGDETESPAHRLEHMLQPWSAGLCVPLFAFAAAGVRIDAGTLRELLHDRLAWAVVAGLLVGKALGVLGGAALAVRFGLARLPADVRWRDLLAVSVLAGCGFTVSLLITELAFRGTAETGRLTLAVLIASVVAATLSAGLLHLRVRARDTGLVP